MNKDKYSVNEEEIVNLKRDEKKEKSKKTIIIILVVLAIVGIISFSIYNSNMKAKAEEERLARIFKEENDVIRDIVDPVVHNYDIYDYEYDHLETDYLYGIVYLKMPDYQKLSNEEKLSILAELAMAVRNKKPFPDDSEAWNKSMDFNIVTNEHTYNDFTSGTSWLMEDGDKIFEMRTDFADEVNKSLNSMLNDSSRPRCNGSVGCRSGFHPCHPMSNGYCNQCCKD